MARTRSHKLILTYGAAGQNLFFDLQKDPLELHNLYGLAEVKDEVKHLTAALAGWRPRKMPERFVDLHGTADPRAERTPAGLEHRQAIMEYYRAKMQEEENRRQDVRQRSSP